MRRIVIFLISALLALILAAMRLFGAIWSSFVAVKARLVAPPVPAAPLVECEWIADRGIMMHGLAGDGSITEEREICNKMR